MIGRAAMWRGSAGGRVLLLGYLVAVFVFAARKLFMLAGVSMNAQGSWIATAKLTYHSLAKAFHCM